MIKKNPRPVHTFFWEEYFLMVPIVIFDVHSLVDYKSTCCCLSCLPSYSAWWRYKAITNTHIACIETATKWNLPFYDCRRSLLFTMFRTDLAQLTCGSIYIFRILLLKIKLPAFYSKLAIECYFRIKTKNGLSIF